MPRAPQEPTRTRLLLCNFSTESSVKAVLLLGLRELTESCVLDFVLDSQGIVLGSITSVLRGQEIARAKARKQPLLLKVKLKTTNRHYQLI